MPATGPTSSSATPRTSPAATLKSRRRGGAARRPGRSRPGPRADPGPRHRRDDVPGLRIARRPRAAARRPSRRVADRHGRQPASLDEFFDRGRRDSNPSTFLTRLKVGPKLVDAKAVATLYRSRVSGGAIALLVLAALVAVDRGRVAGRRTSAARRWTGPSRPGNSFACGSQGLAASDFSASARHLASRRSSWRSRSGWCSAPDLSAERSASRGCATTSPTCRPGRHSATARTTQLTRAASTPPTASTPRSRGRGAGRHARRPHRRAWSPRPDADPADLDGVNRHDRAGGRVGHRRVVADRVVRRPDERATSCATIVTNVDPGGRHSCRPAPSTRAAWPATCSARCCCSTPETRSRRVTPQEHRRSPRDAARRRASSATATARSRPAQLAVVLTGDRAGGRRQRQPRRGDRPVRRRAGRSRCRARCSPGGRRRRDGNGAVARRPRRRGACAAALTTVDNVDREPAGSPSARAAGAARTAAPAGTAPARARPRVDRRRPRRRERASRRGGANRGACPDVAMVLP